MTRQTRCPAPYFADAGALRCAQQTPCDRHPGRRWRLLAPILDVVWRIRPWWPNALGRAQDDGRAHAPLIYPCKACTAERALDHDPRAIRARHQDAAYIPGATR